MHVIHARNVNDGYAQGIAFLRAEGRREASRAGDVLVSPVPVATVYSHPLERVLMDPRRDSNPFFSFFEPLWLLAGRDDAKWLDRFVGDFSKRFAEPPVPGMHDGRGGEIVRLHGSYGRRWRSWFVEGQWSRNGYSSHFEEARLERQDGSVVQGARYIDQLDEVVHLLRENPSDRQAVLQMWDPSADLGVPGLKDRPCNTQVMLRVREEIPKVVPVEGAPFFNSIAGLPRRVLDILVTCRSNDIIWGAYGANMPQFSCLQEYLAGRIGVGVGTYTQLSWNFHAYLGTLEKVGEPEEHEQPYHCEGWYNKPGLLRTEPMGQRWDAWDYDLRRFMLWTDEAEDPTEVPQQSYPMNPWFESTAEPLFVAHWLWKQGERVRALDIVEDTSMWVDMAPDWRAAASAWMRRRIK